jgi:RNA polymerase sigma factor for flagellar operon FliA
MASPPPSDPTPEELFVENLPLIEEIIGHCCRKSHFTPHEAEDFGGHVRLKLIEDDYAVFRKFRGRSSIRTYLTTVISRLLLDYQNHIWTKWRHSAEAERLGRVAMRLEQLLVRDGLGFDEACKQLRAEGVTLSVLEFADLRAKLPPRSLRRFVSDEQLQSRTSPEPKPDEALEAKEQQANQRRIYTALHLSLPILSKEEQILVRMWTEFKVSEISRILKVDQKPLYRRIKTAFEKLKKELARQGVRRKDIEDLLGRLKSGRPNPEDKKGAGPRKGPPSKPGRGSKGDRDDGDEKE